VTSWPVPDRPISSANGATSPTVGTSFSTPATAIWVSVAATVLRALPSLVTSTRLPDSAATKFAPVIPASASAISSPSFSRANAVSSAAVSGGSSGSNRSANRFAIASRDL